MSELRGNDAAAAGIALAGSGPFAVPVPRWTWPTDLPRPLVSALGFLALTLALHLIQFGNPVLHVDEEFYLLVADHMRHGALPFVDIWDRKPLGLFLLYRFFLLFPGDGVVTYQLFGVAACAATALVIERLAREIASPAAARLAGAVYILFLPVFCFGIGQAPVFYNLPVALAALRTLEAWRARDARDFVRGGAQAMALLGLAIQIKYTVVFEGAAFGVVLLARACALGWNAGRLAGVALLWCAVAIAPTLAFLALYAAIGHGEAFIHANFLSILNRRSDGMASWSRLGSEMLGLVPFWLAILWADRRLAAREGHDPAALWFLRLWAIAAFAGFLAFGSWYDHYVTPVLVPLSVLAAPALAQVPGARWRCVLLLGFGAIASVVVMTDSIRRHGTKAQAEHITASIRSELHSGCAFVFDGEPAFYRMAGSCLPGRYAFPNHLNTWTEAKALDIDPNLEVARIMMTRPDVVVVAEWWPFYLPNWETRAIVGDFLARGYERYASAKLGTHTFGLWRRRKG
ncbi:ArnT family glycosyltransferase [Novosphingobium sp.]|uniref:ArnT family glycosyltransferase n=1 Tax=Novosphingobium sp. TaxID=1874826 RepID=UPI0038B99D74